jgi:hypothetical protein
MRNGCSLNRLYRERMDRWENRLAAGEAIVAAERAWARQPDFVPACSTLEWALTSKQQPSAAPQNR